MMIRWVVAATVVALLLIFLVLIVWVEAKGGKAHEDAKRDDRASFWKHSATIDFCEENYRRISWIVEFENTVSSLGICAVALYARQAWLTHEGTRLTAVLLAITGFGSAIFHGTMHVAGQVLDEVGMMAVILHMIFHTKYGGPSRKLQFLGIFVVSSIFYFATSNVAIFQCMFIGAILALTLITIREFDTAVASERSEMLRAFVCFAGGASLWLMEPFVCAQSPFSLHAAWHILSSLGCVYWLRYAEIGLIGLPE